MDRELTQEELMNVTAAMLYTGNDGLATADALGIISNSDTDELDLADLDNVYAGPNRVAMEGKVLEHPGIYRDDQIDALVEARIKAEELAATQDEQKITFGL